MTRYVLWCAVITAASACGDGTEPDPNRPASLQVTTVTTGEDADTDGYTLSLDANPAVVLAANGTVVFTGLAAGEHDLQLGDLAENCQLAGDNPRLLALVAGDTTETMLTVSCQMLAVSHPAGVVARSVPLAGSPYGVAVSGEGIVYAALIASTTLARGDLASMSFGPTVEVGETPPHVAFNPAGTVVYATLQTGRGLAVVDVASNSLVTTLPLGSDGFNLAVAPDGQRVYVTTADGTLYVVNAITNEVVTTLAVGSAANGLAFSPDGTVLYVSSRDAGTVVAIDRVANEVTRTYTVGGAPQRLAVAPDGSELYVANEASGLDVVNVGSGAVTSHAFGSAGYGLGLTPDGAQIYVLLPDAGEVRVLERLSRAPVKTIIVGGRPRNVAFAVDGRTALLANEDAVVFIR